MVLATFTSKPSFGKTNINFILEDTNNHASTMVEPRAELKSHCPTSADTILETPGEYRTLSDCVHGRGQLVDTSRPTGMHRRQQGSVERPLDIHLARSTAIHCLTACQAEPSVGPPTPLSCSTHSLMQPTAQLLCSHSLQRPRRKSATQTPKIVGVKV